MKKTISLLLLSLSLINPAFSSECGCEKTCQESCSKECKCKECKKESCECSKKKDQIRPEPIGTLR